MILIQSSRFDTTTDRVVDWLNYYSAPVVRINEDWGIYKTTFELGDEGESTFIVSFLNQHTSRSLEINLNEITTFWYRRGHFWCYRKPIESQFGLGYKSDSVSVSVENYAKVETDSICRFVEDILSHKKAIGQFSDNNINKLTCLHQASKAGLKVPQTLVARNKSQIFSFQSKHKRIITKGLVKNGLSKTSKWVASCLTQEITEEYLVNLPESFAPSLIQQYIEKYCELRLFYLESEIYCAAIFSQSDPQTMIDFREYNVHRPNRIVPFNLPNEIIGQIKIFMNSIRLSCGSIDMILTPSNQFYFLEVNPIGQFSFISDPCNFELEHMIALNLIRKHGEPIKKNC